jgi:DNA polymerase I-like protein with 3'-5' exonuclease and polymerase domains
VKDEFVPIMKAVMKEEMESALPLKVPLLVKVKTGKRWGSMT